MRLPISHIILALSLLGNALLAWHLVGTSDQTSDHEPNAAEMSTSLLGARQSAPPSSWSQVSSASPERLASQLRTLGCPEHLIRNAVAAAINREFTKRSLAFRSLDSFWNTPAERKIAENDRRGQMWELDQERHEVLEAATGTRSAPIRNWYGIKSSAISAFQFGFVEPGRQEEVIEFVTDMDRQADRLHAAAGALGDDEVMTQRGALYAQYDTFMNSRLSTEERFHAESFIYDMYLFDVWSTTQLFGRKLPPHERISILKILMPPDFIQREMFKLPLESYKDTALQEERREQLRESFGDDILSHFKEALKKRGLANIVFPPGS